MRLVALLSLIALLTTCHMEPEHQVLYSSDAYTLFIDEVVQGEHKASILSPTSIQSNYNGEQKSWTLSADLSDMPQYESQQPIVDALYNLSLEEAVMNISSDSTLSVRTASEASSRSEMDYSILLAFAYLEPEMSKVYLLNSVTTNKRLIQDTDSTRAFSASANLNTWSLAAWELYKVTGDQEWLQTSYEILKNTVDEKMKNIAPSTGLYRSDSSNINEQIHAYPKWMNDNTYISENLNTNITLYRTHVILSKMATALEIDAEPYATIAENLKKAINDNLWMNEMGFYAQYTYGRNTMSTSPRFEALGQSLAILLDVADEEQANTIFKNSPVTPFGTTCIYPQSPDLSNSYNSSIWPFVQAYWNLAAAKTGNETVLEHGLASLYRSTGLFLKSNEKMVAESGDYSSTETDSAAMLSGTAGNLAMLFRVLMGMNFEEGGIRFAPVIPKTYGGLRHLSNFRYREALLDINISGYGNKVKSFTLDGVVVPSPFFTGLLKGNHKINITMMNNDFGGEINMIENLTSPSHPVVKLEENLLVWDAVDSTARYNIFKDGQFLASTKEMQYDVYQSVSGVYQVMSITSDSLTSYLSEPVIVAEDEIKPINIK